MIFSHVSFKDYWKTVLTFIQSVHQMGHYQTRKRICEMPLNASSPVGYALFAVIKATFSNPNGLEIIMNYIQTILAININK